MVTFNFRAECFGLLGVNGAGKTSTFQMLTGDCTFSAGDALIDGFSCKTEIEMVHKRVGYCPQFDALLEFLTGRETMEIFCLLRGIPRSQIRKVCMNLAEELGFIEHLDMFTRSYSGGTKRKLSTALALIDPKIVFLDEPSTGLDPKSKRNLWNIVSKMRSSGTSIILTSHSMEECEALCTRLAIMVNGEFKCLGSTQHLKSKFSKGFILTIKIGKDESSEDHERSVNDIKQFVQNAFYSSVLKCV